jgi:hypothetical protein
MDIITVSIAVAVAMTGYFQLRTAQQKAARDLIDRRIETYNVLCEVVAALQRSSTAATPENEFKFLRAVDRAAFLFDQEIIRELNIFHKAINEVCVSKADNDAVAERKWRDVALGGFYDTLQPLFARYLRIDQQLRGIKRKRQ